MLKINKELKKLIDERKPSVIHFTTSGQLAIIRDILLLKTAKRFNIPTVYHIRFGRIPDISKKNTLEWILLKKAIKLASKTISIDQNTFLTLLKFFNENKICYIANFFDYTSILNIKKDSVGDNKKFKLLFLGWCIKTKGVEELLDAWGTIYNKYTDWELDIVGPYKENYKQYLTEKYNMERVVFTGEKQHQQALYLLKESDVFILPSYTEGFPNVILEAMAFGKPIIASSVGAIPEMLSDDCGIAIKPRNSNCIISALDELLNNKDLQNKLGHNAQKKVKENYSLDIVSKEYKKIWSSLSN